MYKRCHNSLEDTCKISETIWNLALTGKFRADDYIWANNLSSVHKVTNYVTFDSTFHALET